MTVRPGAVDWLMLMSLTVMWGSAFMLTKVALSHMAPDLVVVGRLVVASGLLLAVAAMVVRQLPAGRRLWLFFALIALFGHALPFSLISWGQEYIDSGLAGILMAVVPLVTLILAHFTVPGDRLTPRRGGGFVLGFAGVVVLTGPEALLQLTHVSDRLVPMLAVLGGAVCYAIAAILSRLRPSSDALSSATFTTLMAAFMVLPFLVDEGAVTSLPAPPPAAVGAVVLLGVFSTAVAAIVYFRLIGRAGPSFVSQLNYFIPLWAVAVGVVFLGETLHPNHLTALALILAGVLVTQSDGRRARLAVGEARALKQGAGGD